VFDWSDLFIFLPWKVQLVLLALGMLIVLMVAAIIYI
jgi:hypothetical protein